MRLPVSALASVALLSALPAQAQWHYVGPNLPYEFNDVAVRGNTLVVACEQCGSTGTRPGVYSTDGGATWQDLALTDRRGHGAVATPTGFVFDTRYLHTGTAAALQRVNLTFYPLAYQIFRDPATGTLYRAGQEAALQVSTDDGATWTARPFTGTALQGATFVHARGQTVFVGDHWRLSGGAVSTDGGATWRAVAGGTGGFVAADGRLYRAGSATLSTGSASAALFRSSDGGASWTTLHVAPLRGTAFGQTNGQPHPSFVYVEGATILYSAADNLYRSTDDGQTWSEASQGLPLEFFGSSAVLRRGVIDGGYLYVLRKKYSGTATGYGVYRRPLAELGLAGSVAAEEEAQPTALGLAVSPNPTVGPVAVRFVLDRPQHARVTIVDVLGREVARLHDGPLASGLHRFAWAAAAPAGAYRAVVAGTQAFASAPFIRVR